MTSSISPARISVLFAVLLMLPSDPVLGHPGTHRHLLSAVKQPKGRSCGVHVHDESAHNKAMAKAEAAVYGQRQTGFNSSSALKAAVLASPFPLSGLTVRVQFHVIHYQGYSSITDKQTPPVSDDQLASQLAVINRDYRSAGVAFRVAGAAMFHENQDWTSACFRNLSDIYNAVVVNPATMVNVIICDLASEDGILGVTPEMPNGANEASQSQVVAIDFRTMPGGPYNRYSFGRTLTHELGHYFGLLHTFGSCDVDPDGIADTPAELDAASGCPAARDSCPAQEGKDPVWSFMDYSDDLCMQRFSVGQVARMQAVILQYRPQLAAAGSSANLQQLRASPTPAITQQTLTHSKPASPTKASAAAKGSAKAPGNSTPKKSPRPRPVKVAKRPTSTGKG